MSRLNLKLKTSLKSVIEAESKQSGASKKDPRYLNYFDMKEGQRMEVLFLPCASGNGSWSTDHVHGPRVKVGTQKVKGIAPIGCSRMLNAEPCPICDEMFDHYAAGDKMSGNRLQVTERTTMQVLVLMSDIEVQYPEDGNIVKLFNAPNSIIDKVKQAIMEEQVDEAEMYMTPFVIKVTKNGEYNQYDTSFFKRKSISEEEFDELIEGKEVNQYDFSDGEFTSAAITKDDAIAWLEDTKQKIAVAVGAPTQAPERQASSAPSRAAMAKQDEGFDEDVPASVTEEAEPAPKNNMSDLRSRLRKTV